MQREPAAVAVPFIEEPAWPVGEHSSHVHACASRARGARALPAGTTCGMCCCATHYLIWSAAFCAAPLCPKSGNLCFAWQTYGQHTSLGDWAVAMGGDLEAADWAAGREADSEAGWVAG